VGEGADAEEVGAPDAVVDEPGVEEPGLDELGLVGIGEGIDDVVGRVGATVDSGGSEADGVAGGSELLTLPMPPNSTRFPALSYAIAASARALGAGPAELPVSSYHEAPFHAQVSLSNWPPVPFPPKRIS
jgi:hypothetical protein